MKMINISKREFMASYGYVSIWAFSGLMLAANAYFHYLMGKWFFTIPELVIAFSNAYIVFRLLKYPIVQFRSDQIEFMYRPIFPPKRIPFSDILSLEKSGRSNYKIILSNRKSIGIPIRWVQTTCRELVVSEIENIVRLSTINNVPSTSGESAQQADSWF
jgi:hypothetical protein